MADIKLVNEGGVIVAKDTSTGDTIPIEFDESVHQSVSAADATIGNSVTWPDGSTSTDNPESHMSVFDDVGAAAYSGDSLDISAATNGTPEGLYVKQDGAKLFVVDGDAGGPSPVVAQYSMSTPWDITTASLDSAVDLSANMTRPYAIEFNSDGTKVYFSDIGESAIKSFTVSTAYDLTSGLTLVNDISYTDDDHPVGLTWRRAGDSLVVHEGNADQIRQFSASTAYDITTLTSQETFRPFLQDARDQKDGKFGPRGQQYYIVNAGLASNVLDGEDDFAIYHYMTPLDASLARLTLQGRLDISDDINSAPRSSMYRADGSSIYVLDRTDTVYQYDV